MSKTLPGWILYSKAQSEIRRIGLERTGWKLLQTVAKRRLQPRPGKRRRKYWYIKLENYDRLITEAKARAVGLALEDPVVLHDISRRELHRLTGDSVLTAKDRALLRELYS